ncbi:MAG: hypothetical protein IPJ65_17350 [Archangiaceae bacterium]|nr:hypothetical protein [Archangiaceae bacterium]
MVTISLCLTLLAQTPAPGPSPIRVAVPALKVVNLDEKLGDFYASHLAQQLSYRGINTITATEIAALLGLERQRQLLGCSDDSCKGDLMASLGVDGLLVGSVTRLDKSYQLDVRILAPNGAARPLAAASANTEDGDRLVGIFTVIAAQLADELSQKLGRKLDHAGGAEVVLHASRVKRTSWVPLAVGVAATAAGAVLLAVARGEYNQLLTPRTPAMAQQYDAAKVDSIISAGQLHQTVGWVMVGVGGACVIAAAAMFLLGGNDVVQAGVAFAPGGAAISFSGVLP